MEQASRASLPSADQFAQTVKPLGDVEELLDGLARDGVSITIDDRERVFGLLLRLAEAGVDLKSPHDSAFYLTPLIAKTAEDQARVSRVIADSVERRQKGETGKSGLGDAEPNSDPSPHERGPSRIAWRRFAILMVAAVGVLLLGAVLFGHIPPVGSGVSQVTPPVGPGPGSGPEPASLPGREAVLRDLTMRFMLVAPLLLAGLVLLAQHKFDRSVLTRRRGELDPTRTLDVGTKPGKLFDGGAARRAVVGFRRGVLQEIGAIDVRRSLKATLREGGLLRIVRRLRSVQSDIVMLVDRSGAGDPMRLLADDLAGHLRAADAPFSRYEYRAFPDRLVQVDPRGQVMDTTTLAELADQHASSTLLWLSDAEGALGFVPGDPERRLDAHVVRSLACFHVVHLLTPTPEPAWGETERELTRAGVLVAPLTDAGLASSSTITFEAKELTLAGQIDAIPEGRDALLDRIDRDVHRYTSDVSPPPDEVHSLAAELQDWLGYRDYLLLATVAAFPLVRAQITVDLGRHLQGRTIDADELSKLARLPWMRDSRLPDWLRRAILLRLSPVALARVRQTVDAMLGVKGDVKLPVGRSSAWFGEADADALTGLDDAIFLAVMGNKSLSDDLLNPEAPQRVLDEIGADFVVRHRLLQIALAASVATVFVLGGPILQAGASLSKTVTPFFAWVVPETVAPWLRLGAILSCLASLLAWVWNAQQMTEVESGKAVRFELFVPWRRALELPENLYPFGNGKLRLPGPWRFRWTRQTDWKAPAVLALVLAVMGIAEGADAGLALAPAIMTVAWAWCCCLPVLGGDTAVRLDYDAASTRTGDGEWVRKPGGLDAYPIGRWIAEDRWLWPSLVLALPLLLVTLISLPATTAFLTLEVTATAKGILGASLLLGTAGGILLLRATVFGTSTAPGRRSFAGITFGDIVFAAALTFVAMACSDAAIGVAQPFNHIRLEPRSFMQVPLIIYCSSLIPLIVCRAAMSRSSALISFNRRSILVLLASSMLGLGTATVIQSVTLASNSFAIMSLANNFVHAVRLAGVFAILSVLMLLAGLFRTRRASPVSRETLVRLGIPFMGVVVLLGAVPVLAGGTAGEPTWLRNLLYGASLVLFICTPALIAMWPIWRYFSSAADEIAQLQAEGKLQKRSNAPWLPQELSWLQAGWAWLAAPAIALVALRYQFGSYGTLDLNLLAIPIAVYFAWRYGKKALVPIALGTVPFWLTVHRWPWPIDLPGGIWPAIAILFWARFVSDADLRERLLTRSWRSAWAAAAIVPPLMLGGHLGGLNFWWPHLWEGYEQEHQTNTLLVLLDPGWMLASVLLIFTASRVVHQLNAVLAILVAFGLACFVMSLWSPHFVATTLPVLAPQGFSVTLVSAVWFAIALLVLSLLFNRFRSGKTRNMGNAFLLVASICGVLLALYPFALEYRSFAIFLHEPDLSYKLPIPYKGDFLRVPLAAVAVVLFAAGLLAPSFRAVAVACAGLVVASLSLSIVQALTGTTIGSQLYINLTLVESSPSVWIRDFPVLEQIERGMTLSAFVILGHVVAAVATGRMGREDLDVATHIRRLLDLRQRWREEQAPRPVPA